VFKILFFRLLKNKLISFKNWLKFFILSPINFINLFFKPKSKVLCEKKIFSEIIFKKNKPLKVFRKLNSEININLEFFFIFVAINHPNATKKRTNNFSEKELMIFETQKSFNLANCDPVNIVKIKRKIKDIKLTLIF